MFSFEVGKTTYKIQFGYRVLCETDLIDRIVNLSQQNNVQTVLQIVPELILAGLQKKHYKEFGYETEEEKKNALRKVYDLMDDYEEESTKENPKNCYTLFEDLQNELMKNGFLSQTTKKEVKEVAKKTNATVIPKN